MSAKKSPGQRQPQQVAVAVGALGGAFKQAAHHQPHMCRRVAAVHRVFTAIEVPQLAQRHQFVQHLGRAVTEAQRLPGELSRQRSQGLR